LRHLLLDNGVHDSTGRANRAWLVCSGLSISQNYKTAAHFQAAPDGTFLKLSGRPVAAPTGPVAICPRQPYEPGPQSIFRVPL
jgi:hypothetical protein